MSDLKGVKCQAGLLNEQNETNDIFLFHYVGANQSQFELNLAQLSPSLFYLYITNTSPSHHLNQGKI